MDSKSGGDVDRLVDVGDLYLWLQGSNEREMSASWFLPNWHFFMDIKDREFPLAHPRFKNERPNQTAVGPVKGMNSGFRELQ